MSAQMLPFWPTQSVSNRAAHIILCLVHHPSRCSSHELSGVLHVLLAHHAPTGCSCTPRHFLFRARLDYTDSVHLGLPQHHQHQRWSTDVRFDVLTRVARREEQISNFGMDNREVLERPPRHCSGKVSSNTHIYTHTCLHEDRGRTSSHGPACIFHVGSELPAAVAMPL